MTLGLTVALALGASCDCGPRIEPARASISANPQVLDLGTLAPGASTSLALTVRNAGSAVLKVSSVRVTQDARAAFSVLDTTVEIASGDEVPFWVT